MDADEKKRRSVQQQSRNWFLKQFYQGRLLYLIVFALVIGGLLVTFVFGTATPTSSELFGVDEAALEEAAAESPLATEAPTQAKDPGASLRALKARAIEASAQSNDANPAHAIEAAAPSNDANPVVASVPPAATIDPSKAPSATNDPTGSTRKSPNVVTEQSTPAPVAKSSSLESIVGPRGPRNVRQRAVVAMMSHAWEGYRKYGWGQDEIHPVSKRGENGWRLGLTLVDALDTLYILGMDKEFNDAKEWVKNSLNFSVVGNVNLFETTIRVLGGLLGAEAVSGDPIFLQKARELGDRLLPAFTGKGYDVPFSDIELRTGQGQWKGGSASTSEITTLQLEFKTLSRITRNEVYAKAVERASDTVRNLHKDVGLVPTNIHPDSKRWANSLVTFGARGDSYYEYLLKQWLLTGKTEPGFLEDYQASIRGMKAKLMQRNHVGSKDLTFVGTWDGHARTPQMDHLVCFIAGTLALGATEGGGQDGDMGIAKEIAATCNEMYIQTKSGLAPEITFFEPDGRLHIKPDDAHNLLRPETVESLFYLYRLTGDKVYQDWGWKIYLAFEQHAKVEGGGYSSLKNVLHAPPGMRDKMESFFLAETIKYLFLLFDDEKDQLPLDKFVINTEAHPLRIYKFPDAGHMDSAGIVIDEWRGSAHVQV